MFKRRRLPLPDAWACKRGSQEWPTQQQNGSTWQPPPPSQQPPSTLAEPSTSMPPSQIHQAAQAQFTLWPPPHTSADPALAPATHGALHAAASQVWCKADHTWRIMGSPRYHASPPDVAPLKYPCWFAYAGWPSTGGAQGPSVCGDMPSTAAASGEALLTLCLDLVSVFPVSFGPSWP